MIRLVLFGAIASGVACAFVVVKNRQHTLANAKGNMEAQIVQLDRRIEILDLRIAQMIDHKVLERRLAGDMAGLGLTRIEQPETVVSGPAESEQYVFYQHARDAREEIWTSGVTRGHRTTE